MAKPGRLPTSGSAAVGEPAEGRIHRLRTRYYAYLSYSDEDRLLADWLYRELEKFRVPHALAGRLTTTGVVPRRLTPIFRGRRELSRGDDLPLEIKRALEGAQFLVVLCSPSSVKSSSTNLEIEWFKRTRPEGCVLAAVASGEPFASDIPGREGEECFPPAIRYKYDRRGHRTSKRADPLAADLRESGDGKRLAFLKLVAGMLGVGLDELVQRETTRRHRRLAYVAAAALSGMAVTSTLAITAFQERDAAREQRSQAEGLISFMVGGLRDKLEPIGRLDVLDGVGSRVLAYYDKQDTSELSDDALVQRSRALNLMGEVAFNRGNLEEAGQLYKEAMAGSGEAVHRSEKDPQRIFDHAQNVFWVGEAARFAGHPNEAEAAWREYKRLADQMSAIAPDNLRYRMEVLYANEDVGISLYYQHRFAEAGRTFESAANPMEKLASLYPADTTYQKEFATLLAWMADAERSQGHLVAAIGSRERQISVLERLLAKASDSDARSRLITAHEGLGVVFADNGTLDRAVEELQSAIREAEALIPIEPQNAQWKSMAVDARLQLASALASLGQRDEAAQQTAVGCAIAAALPSAYARARGRLGTNCAMMRFRLALALQEPGQASTFAQRALESARAERSEDPITDRYRVAQMWRLVGDARNRGGNSAGAAAAWKAGLLQLPDNVAERPWEMNERAQLLSRLGRARDAEPLITRLEAIGYHAPL